MENIILFLFPAALWSMVFLLNKGENRRKNIYSFIRNSTQNETHEIHIDQICSALQLDYLKIVKDLKAMISNTNQYHLLKNAYIDLNKKVLILSPNRISKTTKKFNGINIEPVHPPITSATIKCLNCGAQNKILGGKISECEYCGSSLK